MQDTLRSIVLLIDGLKLPHIAKSMSKMGTNKKDNDSFLSNGNFLLRFILLGHLLKINIYFLLTHLTNQNNFMTFFILPLIINVK